MGLLLVGQCADLDHRVTSRGQGEDDLFPVLAGRRHLGLSGEDQIASIVTGGSERVQERQPGQPEVQRRGERACQFGELGDLPVAVQHEQVATLPVADGRAGGGHADPGQPGQQHRPGRRLEERVRGEVGHHRAGGRQQHHIRLELADPAPQLGSTQHLHRQPGGRDDLRRGRHHRVLDHQLCSLPMARQGSQGGCTPLQVGVSIGDGQDPGHSSILPGRGGRMGDLRPRGRPCRSTVADASVGGSSSERDIAGPDTRTRRGRPAHGRRRSGSQRAVGG